MRNDAAVGKPPRQGKKLCEGFRVERLRFAHDDIGTGLQHPTNIAQL